MWDTHMHTCFSGDSDAKPREMIEAAKEKGLRGICFTDHLDYGYPENPNPFFLDVDKYYSDMRKMILECQEIRLLLGIEIGLEPSLVSKIQSVITQYDFDFVIGSTHVVHGMDPYYPDYFQGKEEEEAYRQYFISTLENIKLFDDFDVYGHIDFVVRYGPNKNQYYTYKKYGDILDEILKTLIAKGKGIEINTGGYKYGLGHPNPMEEVINRYRELGGEIITLGSDAHKPKHVAYKFEKLYQILKNAGFEYYTVFQNRKPQFISLEESGLLRK